MKILTQTWLSQPENDGGHFALFTISPELAKEILVRKELMQMVLSKDKDFTSMSFWDFRVEYFGCYASEFIENFLGDKAVAFAEERWVEVPDDFTIADEHGTRSEAERLVLEENHFYWRAGDKYSSNTFETEALPYDLLLPKEKAT